MSNHIRKYIRLHTKIYQDVFQNIVTKFGDYEKLSDND
jgi:hypothetical protein